MMMMMIAWIKILTIETVVVPEGFPSVGCEVLVLFLAAQCRVAGLVLGLVAAVAVGLFATRGGALRRGEVIVGRQVPLHSGCRGLAQSRTSNN